MSSMFGGSTPTPFNQNIGSWNASNVTNFIDFMSTKTPATLSTTNLDAHIQRMDSFSKNGQT